MAANDVAEGVRSAKGDPGMGINVDVRDDMQFDVLLALAPYTTHAEAWQQGREIFSASDTGTALWIAVTSEQATGPTSVSTVLERLPLRELPPFLPDASCLS